jgi:hypothetical protein
MHSRWLAIWLIDGEIGLRKAVLQIVYAILPRFAKFTPTADA